MEWESSWQSGKWNDVLLIYKINSGIGVNVILLENWNLKTFTNNYVKKDSSTIKKNICIILSKNYPEFVNKIQKNYSLFYRLELAYVLFIGQLPGSFSVPSANLFLKQVSRSGNFQVASFGEPVKVGRGQIRA